MRSRNIKPGFYKNEQLAECTFEARLLFPGLWMLADREGIIECRPKKIKAEIFPFDDVNVPNCLNELEKNGLIKIYWVNDGQYIQVVNFVKHQVPHHKEVKSTLPPPEDTVFKVNSNVAPTLQQHCVNEIASCPTDSLNLIPDILIPDILIPDSGFLTPDKDKLPLGNSSSLPDDTSEKIDNCPQKEIIAEYHATLKECPGVRVWAKVNESNMRSRWREDEERQSVEWWRMVFEEVKKSDFLMGRTGKGSFVFSLGWFVKPANFAKVINGNYANRGHHAIAKKDCQLCRYWKEGRCRDRSEEMRAKCTSFLEAV